MSLSSLVAWWMTNGAALVAAIVGVFVAAKAVAVALQKLVDLLPNHQTADTYFGAFIRGCEAVAGFLSGLTSGPRDQKTFSVRRGGPPSGPAKAALVLIALLLAGRAHAQTWSAGLSVPLLEFQAQKTNPVVFAPGAGVQGSVGFFPTTIAGQEADLLILSGTAFASAPGAFQVGVLVGTFNVFFIGAAVPIWASDKSGAAQGSFNVYPLLGGMVAFDVFAPSPSLLEGAERAARPRRFGTVYFGQ